MTQDDKGARAAAEPVAELSYTAASRELDGIVEFFEQRDVDVDQLVSRLERATALIEELDRRLRQTRMQVEQLVPRLSAVLEPGTTPTAEPPAAAEPETGSPPREARPRSAPSRDGSGQGTRWRASAPTSAPSPSADSTPELF